MIGGTARRRLSTVDHGWSETLRTALSERRVTRRLAILAARSGDSWLVLPVLIALWLRLGRAPLALLVGVVATGILVHGVKLAVRRGRPAAEWGASYRRIDPHSFPSGHAARVGAIASFAALTWPPEVAVAVAVWALAVATSRVALGVHYVSDVVAGVALGVATGVLTFAIA
jgi:undecaprenyl-diphosphatase